VRFPFDPRRRRMSVAVAGEVIVKGAPDAVVPLCTDGQAARPVIEALARRGLRILAVAGRPAGDRPPSSPAEAESGLTLRGLLAMEAPPREGVADAIRSCRRAGIAVSMVTGDHPATAEAIATEIGLLTPGSLVISGRELPGDDPTLGALLDRDGTVVARVSPEDKLRIARSLRARRHVAALTGDGVTDGPALP